MAKTELTEKYIGKVISEMIDTGLKLIAGIGTENDKHSFNMFKGILEGFGFDSSLYIQTSKLPGEEWHSIKGYESYQLSNKGRILVPYISYKDYLTNDSHRKINS